LTTGQASPTTPVNIPTKSTPAGNQITPFNPIELVKAAGCRNVVDAVDKDIKGLTQAIVSAIQHQ
jgi:2-oxoglutarate/2-oxoacid ferredoxin oxidoreductase subunit beta